MKKILLDLMSTGFSHFVATLSQIGLLIYVVRVTSKSAFGEYSVVMAIEAIIESVLVARTGEIALQVVGKYWIAGEYGAARRIAEKLQRHDALSNILIYGLLVILSLLLAGHFKINYMYLIGIGLMIPAQIGYGIYKSLFIITHKIKEQAIFECVFSVVTISLGIFGVLYHGIPGLIGALVASALIKNVMARAVTKTWWPSQAGTLPNTTGESHLPGTESLWEFNVHSVLRNAFANGATQADILILNAVRGPESVAIYKAAKSLASLPARISAPLWAALRPRILRSWHESDRKHLVKLIVVPSILMFTALIAAMIPIWFFADDLIGIVYGRGYLDATFPFIILIIGMWIFNGMTSWFNFIVIIGDDKIAGTYTYLLLLLLTFCGGIFYGADSNAHMAITVTTSMIATSAVCWVVLAAKIRLLPTINPPVPIP